MSFDYDIANLPRDAALLQQFRSTGASACCRGQKGKRCKSVAGPPL